jgi:hypothetical protein
VLAGEVDPAAGWLKFGKRVKRQQISQQFIVWATLVFAAIGAVTGILALVRRLIPDSRAAFDGVAPYPQVPVVFGSRVGTVAR